ncbi:hypothetical protein KP77_09650 [Jeotgalibacillus alimentarius]|uniref:Uncharacterized protein n=1 Tax=Jeotgalibacillus alimentarius TaxID=135826 RepID=A0A0C2W5Z1_9BACL|nr:hypothetical protein [Jeotgalibacillus alimentarius]KIL51453.1 hypothetical protein KP77_09650 [Jeotgalibacillus alimentarius]
MNKKVLKAIIFGVFIVTIINITGIFHNSALTEEQVEGFVKKHELDPIAVKNGDDMTFILVEEGLYEVSHLTAKYDSDFTPYAWTESDRVMVRVISGDIVAASVVFNEELSSQANVVTVQYADGTSDSAITDGDGGAFLLNESDMKAEVAEVIVSDEAGNILYHQEA